jgi:hypothetical protein
MAAHFEELWEQCEKLHQAGGNSSNIVDELIMKLNLYKIIDQKTDIPKEELQKIKARTMGEIILTITNLSLVDNINVFEALNMAKQYRNIEMDAKIPPTLRIPGR